jgi:DNA topoisomerase I
MGRRVRRLVLAEKNSAARRLVQVLSKGKSERVREDGITYFRFTKDGDEFVVVPLRGHVVEIDYPSALQDWQTTDLERLIDAEPVRLESPPALHDALRELAADADEAILATDYDREGELIGVEALETLRSRRPDLPARRARFSAMTPSEIRSAFENLVEPDWALAQAAAARQKIDLAWGAVLTRFLTLECGSERQVLSAGRVQTPTLRIIVDREREREDFVPRPFWNVVLSVGSPAFEATAPGGPFWDRGAAKAIVALAGLDGEKAVVEKIEHHERREPPPPPFNTTSFLAQASREGLTASRAMAAAQELYVRGEISYPRTDNTVYPSTLPVRQFLEKLRESLFGEYASRLLAEPALEASRGPIQTTDHPPIHPTAAPAKYRAEVRTKVYGMIARRFLATLSPASVSTVTEAHLVVGNTRFLATGRTVVEPGWREILPDHEAFRELPPLQEGEAIPVQEIRIVEGKTKGPPLHSQGSLLLAMQRLDLGTKSTRHEIIDLLFRRQYVSGRGIRTTAAGRALVEALAIHGPRVAGPEMTAHLEDRMTAIAEGRATLEDVVAESKEALRGVLGQLKTHRDSLSRWLRDATFLEKDYGPCDICGTGRLVRRRARNGWTFLGCSGYPACKHRMRLGTMGQRLPWAIKDTQLGPAPVAAAASA